jgi:pilus assembly protein CpaD
MWLSKMEPLVINPRKALTLLAGAAMAAALAGCQTDEAAGPDLVTTTQQFAMEAKPQPFELRLAVHPGGVSQNQAYVLGGYARDWTRNGGGEITLQSPSGGGEAAQRTANTAREVLIASGVAPDRVRIVAYDGSTEVEAPVIVGYQRYAANVPSCGGKWGNIAAVDHNRATGNFGCAVTANMAAQIADPTDIVHPHDGAPADASRRQTVLDHYRKGEATSSAKDAQADGAISRAVQ